MGKFKDLLVKRHTEFSPFYRWHHWIRFFSIMFLIVSGFYIAYPFLSPEVDPNPTGFLYAKGRTFHEIAGFIMISMFIGKMYYFFFVKSDRNEMRSFKDLFSVKKWMKQTGYYLLVSKHPVLSGAYNVIQLAAYLALYIMLTLLILTGLILYIHNYHDSFLSFLTTPLISLEVMFGGLASVREIHHILTWGIIIFIIAHVYMAVFNAVYGKEGTIDAIVSGYKWEIPESEK
ncbi:MAG: Ni/Fe-hydrogenase, b-type cytochrome subunit [Sulfurospirillum sp.]